MSNDKIPARSRPPIVAGCAAAALCLLMCGVRAAPPAGETSTPSAQEEQRNLDAAEAAKQPKKRVWITTQDRRIAAAHRDALLHPQGHEAAASNKAAAGAPQH